MREDGVRAPTEQLARFVVDLELRDVPESHRRLARFAILDTLGVSVPGAREVTGRIISDFARSLGGDPAATVIGADFLTSAANAALANGTIAHAMDYDDMHTGLWGHASVVLTPTVFAVGEELGASGRAVLEAFVAGFEVLFRVGREMGGQALSNGYHPTGVWAPIGAAVAAAKLLGMTADQTARAMGIAASQASGIRANFGTMVKP